MIADGDPSALCPDLYSRLWPHEKLAVTRMFRARLGMQGRGDPRYRDDESPASVARRTLLLGVTIGHLMIATPELFVAAAALSVLSGGGAGPTTWIVFSVGSACAAVWAFLTLIRVTEIRHYFARASPVVQIDTSATISKPMLPAGPPGSSGLAGGVQDASPGGLAPILYAKFSRPERYWVNICWGQAWLQAGVKGNDEVARLQQVQRAFVWGVRLVYGFGVFAVPLLLEAITNSIADASTGWPGIVFIGALALVIVGWIRRRRQIRKYFAGDSA